MIKSLFVILFFITSLFSSSTQLVPISIKTISYKSKIFSQNIRFVKINDKFKCNKYIDVVKLKRNKYFAKHFISKNKPLCAKDVFIQEVNKINFRFGNLEIEKNAELMNETKSYIRIKNLDGKIEKIYTDGRR